MFPSETFSIRTVKRRSAVELIVTRITSETAGRLPKSSGAMRTVASGSGAPVSAPDWRGAWSAPLPGSWFTSVPASQRASSAVSSPSTGSPSAQSGMPAGSGA